MKTLFITIIIILNLNLFSYDLSNQAKRKIINEYISIMPKLFGSVLKDNQNIIMDSFSNTLQMLNNKHSLIDPHTAKTLENDLEIIKTELTTRIRLKPDFNEISRTYGIIAAYSFFINNPVSYLNIADHHKSVIMKEYLALINFHRNRFRILFYGFYDNWGTMDHDHIRQNSIKLQEAFMKDSHTIYPHRFFDERSVPFGIAQMHLSSAFDMTSAAWFHVWKNSGGYIKDSPYHNIAPAEKGQFLLIID